MTFGMPRALFAVLSVSCSTPGPAAPVSCTRRSRREPPWPAILTGWLEHARRLGLIVIWAVLVWGVAIALVGTMTSLWVAAALLAVAGTADSVSAVCHSTINQTVTPDHMRGRMSSVFSLVVTGGPRLGDIESGTVAGAAGVRFSVVSGGVLCILGVGLIVAAFPALARYDTADWIAQPTPAG
jgi:MFS family permease